MLTFKSLICDSCANKCKSDRDMVVCINFTPAEEFREEYNKEFRMWRCAKEMYDVLSYCYPHIRDAFQSGVDITACLGDMEWRMREVLTKIEEDK